LSPAFASSGRIDNTQARRSRFISNLRGSIIYAGT
jgi:hypothetical protein